MDWNNDTKKLVGEGGTVLLFVSWNGVVKQTSPVFQVYSV
jgi:hypothetical protein